MRLLVDLALSEQDPETGRTRWNVVTEKVIAFRGVVRTKAAVIQRYRNLIYGKSVPPELAEQLRSVDLDEERRKFAARRQKDVVFRKSEERSSASTSPVPVLPLQGAWTTDGPEVGKCLVRCFQGIPIVGRVAEYCPETRNEAALWRIAHSDDDTEDLDADEIKEALDAFANDKYALVRLYKLVVGSSVVTDASSGRNSIGTVLHAVPRAVIDRSVFEKDGQIGSSRSSTRRKKRMRLGQRRKKKKSRKTDHEIVLARLYGSLTEESSKEDVLKIIEYPQSGWTIETVRRPQTGIQTTDRVDRYFCHPHLIGNKSRRFRSILEVKRAVLSERKNFMKTRLVVRYRVKYHDTGFVESLSEEAFLRLVQKPPPSTGRTDFERWKTRVSELAIEVAKEYDEVEDDEPGSDESPDNLPEMKRQKKRYADLVAEAFEMQAKRGIAQMTTSDISEYLVVAHPELFRGTQWKSVRRSVRDTISKSDAYEHFTNDKAEYVFTMARRIDPETVEDLKCQKCGKGDRPDTIVLCGEEKGNNHGCGRGWHIKCLRPRLSEIPECDWFCKVCSKKGTEGLPLPIRIKARRIENCPGYEPDLEKTPIPPLGADVYVWWKKRRYWYTGVVKKHGRDGHAKIHYLDGDALSHDFSDEFQDRWRFCLKPDDQ